MVPSLRVPHQLQQCPSLKVHLQMSSEHLLRPPLIHTHTHSWEPVLGGRTTSSLHKVPELKCMNSTTYRFATKTQEYLSQY